MERSSTRRGAATIRCAISGCAAELLAAVLERLAEADAFRSLGLDRRDGAMGGARARPRRRQGRSAAVLGRRAARDHEPDADLPPMPLGEHVVEDYRHLSLSLKAHPVAFLRGGSRRAAFCAARRWRRVARAARHRGGPRSGAPAAGHGQGVDLHDARGRDRHRQYHRLAEDVRAPAPGRHRRAFVAVTGRLQSESGVIHVIAERIEDLTPMLGLLSERGPQIDPASPADEARRSEFFGDERPRGLRASAARTRRP